MSGNASAGHRRCLSYSNPVPFGHLGIENGTQRHEDFTQKTRWVQGEEGYACVSRILAQSNLMGNGLRRARLARYPSSPHVSPCLWSKLDRVED
ncbi:hypothetical protein M407DRAFT_27584 [Tulasnella calospora MUT 4182]|uniref:Uncharacterized protein n=1 Tax=Tulasnella calospora MUT 4182 TaxID=1051891 RepID=A0A0C3QDP3_9AGAM|nr:hypothetical protein M407DRAFT_27584 [Tulasnella calospora MUT 4182]